LAKKRSGNEKLGRSEVQKRNPKKGRATKRSVSSSRIFERDSLALLRSALENLENGFSALPSTLTALGNKNQFEKTILEVAERLKDNYPYFHPLYAGQMLKPPHPMARIAYMLAMWINPNNHALDGGRASSAMEKEAVAEIAGMFGWKEHVGHLTGGGTMANLEALWIAGQLNPGKKVVASEQAHYTHSRISNVLGLKFESIRCESEGRMDIDALREVLAVGDVGTVVATIGTTATGSVDPLPQLLELRERYGFRLHADAAYGGYFVLADNLGSTTKLSFDRICEVDSIVVDPHKHGLQPYGCGCIIFRDPSVARFYRHDSPYTYFTSKDLHLGEISLECSRAGASAVGLWATQRLLPLVKGGEFAKSISAGREAALKIYGKLEADNRFVIAFQPELDIVVWAPKAKTISEASELSRAIFDEAARRNLHLALAELPANFFNSEIEKDRDTITCLRSVLMKQEHLEWSDRIWEILDVATNVALSKGNAKEQIRAKPKDRKSVKG
jgi:tyrosine decarboxylase / aspartate 1-decarboxylase